MLCDVSSCVGLCGAVSALGKLSRKSNVGGGVAACCLWGQAFSGSAESEGCIAIQVSCQEIPCRGKFCSHKSQSHQPCSHGKFRIFRLLWLWACCSQFLCHFGKCKAKLNVAFQLSGMKSVFLAVCRLVKLEKSEFDCSLCKGCVLVQHMVSAVVVMLISAVVCTV